MDRMNTQKPNWIFSIEETSAGVYEISCLYSQGRKVAIKGTDPDSLISQATTEINRIECAKHIL